MPVAVKLKNFCHICLMPADHELRWLFIVLAKLTSIKQRYHSWESPRECPRWFPWVGPLI